jgi:transposase
MSERDLQRIEVLGEVLRGQRTITSAATVLALSARQVHRLLRRYREYGAGGLTHRARGRRANNRIKDAVREHAIELVRTNYPDFGPTLAAEVLAEKHDLVVSRETLRTWMTTAGLWLSRRQRRHFHQPRLRRECLGELVQIDGSEHRWFEGRADPCTLLVFIDDATSRLMQLRFVPSETTFSYFEALEGYLGAHGRPLAFYSDKHSVFRVSKKDLKSGQGMTQFGRALAELNIEILCANSSQAKGRVERVNRTLQDRLVKELRLAGIGSIEAGNAFLPGFIERFNARFAVAPARPHDLHRPLLNLAPDRLRAILCRRELRHVGQQLTLSFERKLIMLEQNEATIGLAGQYVDTCVFADGRLGWRCAGRGCPCLTGRSTRTSGSIRRRSSRTSAWARSWPSSSASRISARRHGC